jgi:hypothetical protein
MTYGGRTSNRPATYRIGGNQQAGAGPTPIGATVPSSNGGSASSWTPTVTHLLVILVIEIAAFAALRYAFRVIKV